MKNQATFIDQILQNRILSHVLFWAALFITTTVLGSINMDSSYPTFINNLVLLPLQLGAAYLLTYYQVAHLFWKKKYVLFLLSLVGSIFVFSVLARWAIVHIAEPLFRTNFEQETFLEILLDPAYLMASYFPAVYLLPLILLITKTIKERFEEKHEIEVLQKEKSNAELRFLKAQIHPHFLFNTLNNLYALTLDKSDVAPEVVIKLSEMLDYMLYQCNDPEIEIHKEVDLIQNYIDLEQLRYGDSLDLVFNQVIEDSKTMIAPLILLSLVENAFKHGVSGNLKNPLVHINLKVSNAKLLFKVFNTKSPVKQELILKKGLGSNNITRQLDLIYPNKHVLKIDDEADSYQVTLEIDLNEEKGEGIRV